MSSIDRNQKALASAPDPAGMRREIDEKGSTRLEVEGHPVELTADDVQVELSAKSAAHAFTWRIHAVRAQALRALGQADRANAELQQARERLRQVADTIPEPDLRQTFEAEPLAAEVLTEAAPDDASSEDSP